MAEATEAQVRMIFIKGRGKNSRVLICFLLFMVLSLLRINSFIDFVPFPPRCET